MQPRDVRAAVEYMRANLGRRITMADLVAVSGVAERTLNKHFRAFLGIPPMRYLRRLRLASARQRLGSRAHDASVTSVATDHGFHHFGRFALQYRLSFGESPSSTLRRGILARCDPAAQALAAHAAPLVLASQPDPSRRALELLHRALDIDPGCALASALAAWAHSQLVMYNATSSPAADKARALELARRAAFFESDDALALTARCAVHTMAGEFEAASVLIERALALDPHCAWAWARRAWLASYLGNAQEAIADFRRCLSLDPRSSSRSNTFVGIGSAHFHAGRYEAAARCLRQALAEEPSAVWANRTLSVAYARLGERSQALKALAALRRYCPDLTVGRVVAAIPFRPDYLRRLGEGLSDLGLPA